MNGADSHMLVHSSPEISSICVCVCFSVRENLTITVYVFIIFKPATQELFSYHSLLITCAFSPVFVFIPLSFICTVERKGKKDKKKTLYTYPDSSELK